MASKICGEIRPPALPVLSLCTSGSDGPAKYVERRAQGQRLMSLTYFSDGKGHQPASEAGSLAQFA